MTIWKQKPKCCDYCQCPIMSVFYDAATPRGWGNFCPACFIDVGGKLGTGLGQRYELNLSDKKYHKTAG